MNMTMRDQVQARVWSEHRHIVQVHALQIDAIDGLDRTFLNSGAGDRRACHHAQARMTLDSLRSRVMAAGLPVQWLLDQRLLVETYDRKKREHRTTEWQVVFVPLTCTWVHTGDTVLVNKGGHGPNVVLIGDRSVVYPAHAALDKAEEA